MTRAPRALLLAAIVAGAPGLAHAGWETRTVAGVETEVYAPASLSPVGDGRGLLIVLHGCTQTAKQIASLANLQAGAEAFGVVMAVPQVPGGGVYAGCWDYYGTAHDRMSRHDDDLLGLASELGADPALKIDPDQVYVAGLSSGGGEALVLGCLAPDVFAGIGLAASPGLGTEVFEFSSVSTTAAEAAALCETFAGAAAPRFADQLTVVYNGSMDFTVAQGYAPLNVETMSIRYGGGLTESALDVASLAGYEPAGEGTIWSDGEGPRIARILGQGGGHAWPAGTGPGAAQSFVEPKGVDLGAFMAEFFTENNRRVDGGQVDTTDGSSSGDDTSGSGGTEGTGSTGGTGGTGGTGSSGGTGSGGSSDGSDGSSDGTCDAGGTDDGGSTGGGVMTSAGALTSGGLDRGGEDEGCACRSGGPPSSAIFGLLLLALAGRRRRSS
ncbi:MAG: PHB depolymerase family esterase [Nannocystaceae bacterium]